MLVIKDGPGMDGDKSNTRGQTGTKHESSSDIFVTDFRASLQIIGGPLCERGNDRLHALLAVQLEALCLCDRRDLDVGRAERLLHHLLEHRQHELLGLGQRHCLVVAVLERVLRALGAGADGLGVADGERAGGIGRVPSGIGLACDGTQKGMRRTEEARSRQHRQ